MPDTDSDRHADDDRGFFFCLAHHGAFLEGRDACLLAEPWQPEAIPCNPVRIPRPLLIDGSGGGSDGA